MKILGLSASLRDKRHGEGSGFLVDDIENVSSKKHLMKYLENQAQFSLSEYIEAGRKENQPFDVIYRNLKRLPGTSGLSNSEIFLTAALWGAKNNGAEIEHVSLSNYFGKKHPSDGNYEDLIHKVKMADGIILSGPVYFGDRSSLAHDFLQLLRGTVNELDNKIFAGVTVGAKRNGGQETCLIYKMIDFINLGFLGVGNDAATTAQYGGTGHAGEVGAGARDEYGIKTAIGTGNRVAQVLKLIKYSDQYQLIDKPKIGIFILQDVDSKTKYLIEKIISESQLADIASFKLFYFPEEFVRKCIACDICPKTIGNDEDYRCIIKDRNDLFVKHHGEIIDLDALLIGGYSPYQYANLKTIYQVFMERTRYIRRSDYIYSNRLISPFVFQEIGSRENFHTRILTSFIRHHTIIHKPILFNVQDGNFFNFNESLSNLKSFVHMASKLTVGRIRYNCNEESYTNYMPFGYTLSTERDREPATITKRATNMEMRLAKCYQMMKDRIKNENK